MKRVGVYIGVLLLAAVGVTSCGGGSNSDTAAAGSTIARAEFVKRADAICVQGAKERDEAALAAFKAQRERATDDAGRSTQRLSEAIVAEKILPPLATMTDELAELSPPDAGVAQAEAMVTAFQDAMDQAEAELDRVIAGQVDPFRQARQLAGEYGVKACAEI